MSEFMDDERFEELVNEMKHRHNDPPETPRERMWERIEAARSEKRAAEGGNVVRPDFEMQRTGGSRIWRLAAAAAAILVLGIAVGRMLPDGDAGFGPAPRAEAPAQQVPAPEAVPERAGPGGGDARGNVRESDPLLYTAAADLFGRADVLLTDLRSTSCATDDLTPMPRWADGMLVQTRLLLGAVGQTDKTDDPEAEQIESLLLDLELTLVQIVSLAGGDCDRDVAWIRKGMEERSTVERLRLMSDAVKNQRPL